MYKTLSSTETYKNPWIRVREDIIERPSGEQGLYGVVEKNDFAAIIAVDNGQIHLVEQYRYPIAQPTLEIPMGGWTDQPDADPMQLALGELREETGYQADKIEKIGFHHVDNGTSTQGCHIFLASQLHFVGQQLDNEEEGLIACQIPLEVFEQKIISGEITDACTIACYGLAKLKGLL
ncbi:NUDIX domain-containing protein [Reinekea thalattae]|uniref:GDP-mannose pyrophosphatase n=1 Tax=Reinekea thalattae TaxID=2593301 RepID=A0A5C8Z9D6_9GAMM|nr:NUDIX hydrolase [Reinekea thalattae]TXR53480.1 NUDIX hydrolase [Reinekea thalattae]